jgi:uncharacterized membrane protein YhaH (DUF805 family)
MVSQNSRIMKKCTYCGKECDDSATNCPIDGQALAPIIPQPPPRLGDSPEHLSAKSQGLFFPQQIGRASFVVRYILFMISVLLGACLLAVGASMKSGVPALTVLVCSAAVLLFALFYFIRHMLVARLRDIGIHNLFGLLIFVPFLNILFLIFLATAPRDGFRKQQVPSVG